MLADGSALPPFITYDVYTKIATVNVVASREPVTLTVKACAYLNDKVTTPKNECRQTVIQIIYVASSLAFN